MDVNIEQKHELVSTQTCNEISLSRNTAQPAGNVFQYLVACRVTVQIVNAFEAVKVNEQERHCLARPFGTR